MSATFKVQKGVPLPEIDRAPKTLQRKYWLENMAVGDMFFVPGRTAKSLSSYISRISKDVPGKFSARHCWMREVDDNDVVLDKWEPCTPTQKHATEGAGVWRIE